MARRIVIASFGSHGDILPYIGLALGLRDRGYEPVLAIPGFYRREVEAEGLEIRPIRPELDPGDDAMVRRLLDPLRGSEFLLRNFILGSLEASHADLLAASRGADLIIGHPLTFAAPIVAEQYDIPWVSTILSPMLFFSRFDLPVFSPFPWTKRLEGIPGVTATMMRGARFVTGRWLRPVAGLRRDLGLPPGENALLEGQHSPDLVLALFSRVLADPQPDWPQNVRLTGAIPYGGVGGEADLPPAVERFLEAGDAPVVFTLGSAAVWSPGRFFEESAEAVGRLGVRGILLAGQAAPQLTQLGQRDDLLVVDRVAHGALFPRASAVVHQGGIGTLQHGLRAGVPTLVVPFAHDQFDNAYRAERLGVSRTLPPPRYRADRAADLIRALLSEPTYRARAGEVAAIVQAEEAVRVACDAIERLFASSVPPYSSPG